MLYFVVALSLLSVAYAESETKPVVKIPPSVRHIIDQTVKVCLTEVGASQEVADNYYKLDFGTDLPSKKFLYCLCYKTNHSYEDGRLNDTFVNYFNSNDRKDDVKKVIEDCNKIKEKNNYETLHAIALCFIKNTPVLLIP